MRGPEVRYRLPDSLRERLQEPLAEIVDEEGLLRLADSGRLGRPRVCVGDIVCETLLRLGLEPHILVFDLSTMRGPVPEAVERRLTGTDGHRVRVENPAGTITRELEQAIKEAFGRPAPTWIQVDGEEDLAGLPAIVHAPDGATMIYGMPNQGLVPVPVMKRSRNVAGTILSLMKVGPGPQRAGPTEGG